MIAAIHHGAGRGESDPLAELAQADRPDRSVRRQAGPRSRCSRAASATAIFRVRAVRSARRSRQRSAEPAVMDAARRHEPAPPPPLPPQDYDDEPEYQPAPVHPSCTACIATAPATAGAEQDYYEEPQFAAEPHDRRATRIPSRYDDALYGQIEPGDQRLSSAIRPIRTIRYAYQNDGYEERRARAEEALERHDDGRRRAGAGRGRDGRCLRLSHLRRFAPQRRAADHQGRQQPDQGGAGPVRWRLARRPDRLPSGDGGEKLVSREETPVDVNSQVRRTARGISAAEPEQQSAAGRERVSDGATLPPAGQRHRCRTTSRARSRRSRSRAIGRERRHPRRRYRASGTAGPTTRPLPPAPRQPLPRPAAQPAIGQCQRQCADVAVAAGGSRSAPPTRDGGDQSDPASASRQAVAAIWFRCPRRRTRPMRRPPTGRCRASSRSVLGSRSPVIKRADLGDKGVYYRAMVGPFGSPDEASQFCGSLKTAGGQCVVQRN